MVYYQPTISHQLRETELNGQVMVPMDYRLSDIQLRKKVTGQAKNFHFFTRNGLCNFVFQTKSKNKIDILVENFKLYKTVIFVLNIHFKLMLKNYDF